MTKRSGQDRLAALAASLTEAELAALIRADFALFAQQMYPAIHAGERLVWAPYLDLIASRLCDIAHGRRTHLIITLPPRHLKSFLASVALPAFFLGHYPNLSVMCVSHGADLAREFARDTQGLMECAPYCEVFGALLEKRQSLNLLHTRFGGARRATSLDGTATGVGGELIIFDDPQKAGEAPSEAIRRATNEAYRTTFISRGNDPATVRKVIVMQRLHEDDFVGHVTSLEGETWEILNLPAIAEEDQAIAFETPLGRHMFRRQCGQALHPVRVPLKFLLQFRESVGEAVWAAQYQQRPAPAGGGLVKIDWFRRYADGDLPTFDHVMQSWDTANTVKESSAFSVCTTWGVKGKHLWLLHVLRRRMIYPDLKRAVIAQAELHDAAWVLVEDHASGTQLLQELRQEGFGKLRPVKPVHDKETRMVNQTAIIEAGRVHIPHEAPWLADYLHELAVFPNGRFADQVDSTSQALAGANTWSEGRGILEFIRQEQEAKRVHDDEILVLKGPPGLGQFNDIETVEHFPQADGFYHLTRLQAGQILNYPGWTLIRSMPAAPRF